MMIKTTLLIISLFFSMGEEKLDTEVTWVSIDEAQELVKENPRKVFVDIYADWCSWCKVMDKKTFNHPKVAQYIQENYYAVRIDAESNEEVTFNGKKLSQRELAKSFKVTGLPTIVFIDENFKKVKPVAGYQEPNQFLRSLQKFNR